MLVVKAEQSGQSIEQTERDIRRRLNVPSETPPFFGNYLASDTAKNNMALAKVFFVYQKARFARAEAPVDRALQVRVIDTFLNGGAVDISNKEAVAAILEGNNGGAFGALPPMQDMIITQGMRLGAGYDVLKDTVNSATQCVTTRDLDVIRQKQHTTRLNDRLLTTHNKTA